MPRRSSESPRPRARRRAPLELRPGRLELALLAREDPGHVERVRPQLGRLLGGGGERGLERLAALGQVAVDLPEPPHADDEP